MAALSALLIRSILLASVKARPGVDVPDETIDGFPEFAFTIDTINDPTVTQKLRVLAKKIVVSHSTPNRIIGFETHGHADVTLRIPPGAERDRAELEVSRDRAENAKELLLKLIEEEGGKPIITGIRANAEAEGFGSRFRKFTPATTDAQMRRNRRVEIFLKRFNQPPPKPSPPPIPKPPPVPDVGSHWSIQIKSGTIISAPLPPPLGDIVPASISLKVEIIDLDRKQKATFDASAKGVVLPGGSAGVPQPIVAVPGGPPTKFATASGVTLNTFNGDVTIAQNPAAGVIVTIGGEFVFDFEALSPVLTRPRAIEVSPGFSVALPTLGGGIAPGTGTMKMQGSPAKAP
jgi:hypothetical protein